MDEFSGPIDGLFAAVKSQKIENYLRRRIDIDSLAGVEARAAVLELMSDMRADLTDPELLVLVNVLSAAQISVAGRGKLRAWLIEALPQPVEANGRECLLLELATMIAARMPSEGLDPAVDTDKILACLALLPDEGSSEEHDAAANGLGPRERAVYASLLERQPRLARVVRPHTELVKRVLASGQLYNATLRAQEGHLDSDVVAALRVVVAHLTVNF